MRYLTAALAFAFAVGTMSMAQACSNMMKTAQVASADGQTAPPSTKVRIPTRRPFYYLCFPAARTATLSSAA